MKAVLKTMFVAAALAMAGMAIAAGSGRE